jgi:hypothetical protein
MLGCYLHFYCFLDSGKMRKILIGIREILLEFPLGFI